MSLQLSLRVLAVAACCCCATTQDSYVAAVVEYSPHASVSSNLDAYRPLVQHAAGGGADVVVFPEDGMIGFAGGRSVLIRELEVIPPSPSESPEQARIVPCNNSAFSESPNFQSLSCLARDNSVILMVNYGDKQPCSANSTSQDCPSDGFFLYNTNIVFDKDGSYLAKYHKVHLYGGEAMDFNYPPASQKPVFFKTSIGVTFGVFTCFDILFNFPTFDLVEQGVKNFLFSTYWGSEFPALISIAIQQSWSRVTKTNLIAANLNCQQPYCLNLIGLPGSGSGIYSSGAVQNLFVSGDALPAGEGVVRMAVVSANPTSPSIKHHSIPKQGSKPVLLMTLTDVDYRPLDSTVNSGVMTATMESFTCSLAFSFKQRNTTERYALGVFYGKKIYGLTGFCILLKCSEEGCGLPLMEAYSVFDKIELTGSFPSNSRVFPLIVGSDLTLLDPLLSNLAGNTLTIHDGTDPVLAASLWAQISADEK